MMHQSFQPFLLPSADLSSHALIRLPMRADFDELSLEHSALGIEQLSSEFKAIAWSEGREIYVGCRRVSFEFENSSFCSCTKFRAL